MVKGVEPSRDWGLGFRGLVGLGLGWFRVSGLGFRGFGFRG